MSFLLPCPVCGPRDVYEFRFGGEVLKRPLPDANEETWSTYRYLRRNTAGLADEWWFHRAGCRRWFQAQRHTTSNTVTRSWWSRGSGSTGSARDDEPVSLEADGA